MSKTCPYCAKTSYSASDQGKWNCAYCGKDISQVPVNEEKNLCYLHENSTKRKSTLDKEQLQ